MPKLDGGVSDFFAQHLVLLALVARSVKILQVDTCDLIIAIILLRLQECVRKCVYNNFEHLNKKKMSLLSKSLMKIRCFLHHKDRSDPDKCHIHTDIHFQICHLKNLFGMY